MSIADAKCSKSPGNHDMVEDVMLEILLRLPVKSLVRFKCVCKQWYAIIESKIFVEQHFCHNQESLLVPNYKCYENRHAYALFLDDICSGFEEPAHLQLPNMLNEVLGPVNGVFCLVGRWRELALLNPATRQLKPLPKLPEVNNEPNFSSHENVLGFGLDALSGDYKVVSIWYFYDLEMDFPDCNTMVFVYNLGSDSWRISEDVGCFKTSPRACISPCKTFFNGVYYWAMMLFDNTVAAVLAFDMTTEKFQEIQIPDCCKSKSGYLTMHGDSIALVSYGNDCCEVWVMEKEGSWNRGAVLGPYPANSLPLCLWKNDLFLREGNTSFLTLYNVCTKKGQVTRVRVKPNADILSVFSYKESLVSIKGNVDNCMLWDASRDILAIAWEYNNSQILQMLIEE